MSKIETKSYENYCQEYNRMTENAFTVTTIHGNNTHDK